MWSAPLFVACTPGGRSAKVNVHVRAFGKPFDPGFVDLLLLLDLVQRAEGLAREALDELGFGECSRAAVRRHALQDVLAESDLVVGDAAHAVRTELAPLRAGDCAQRRSRMRQRPERRPRRVNTRNVLSCEMAVSPKQHPHSKKAPDLTSSSSSFACTSFRRCKARHFGSPFMTHSRSRSKLSSCLWRPLPLFDLADTSILMPRVARGSSMTAERATKVCAYSAELLAR